MWCLKSLNPLFYLELCNIPKSQLYLIYTKRVTETPEDMQYEKLFFKYSVLINNLAKLAHDTRNKYQYIRRNTHEMELLA